MWWYLLDLITISIPSFPLFFSILSEAIDWLTFLEMSNKKSKVQDESLALKKVSERKQGISKNKMKNEGVDLVDKSWFYFHIIKNLDFSYVP